MLILIYMSCAVHANDIKFPVYDLKEGLSLVRSKEKPAIIYFGSKSNNFFKYAINEDSQKLLKNGSVIFILVNLDEKNYYPLSGKMEKGEHVAELLCWSVILLKGATDYAGSFVTMRHDGRLMPMFSISHVILDYNANIFNDVLHYLKDRVYDKKIKDKKGEEETARQYDVAQYGVSRNHGVEWKELNIRQQNPDVTKSEKLANFPFHFINKKNERKRML